MVVNVVIWNVDTKGNVHTSIDSNMNTDVYAKVYVTFLGFIIAHDDNDDGDCKPCGCFG